MTLAQLELAAGAGVSPTTTSSSVFGKGHVEVKKNVEEAVVVGSGLVRLRRREEGEGEVQEREQGLGPGLGLRPGQGGQEAVKKEEGEAQSQGEEEVLQQAPEQNSLDAQADWTIPVEWTGTVRERNVAGADVGNRLYAGKKRMFKGHKWERTRERRVGRTEMLLRDMDKRIQRFKGVRFTFYFRLSFFPPSFFSPPSSSFLFADGVFVTFLFF